MRCFGNPADGSFCRDMARTKVPVGARCAFCAELIADSDCGFMVPCAPRSLIAPRRQESPCEAAWHRECFLRQLYGSVGHQRKTCFCYGGTEEDPVGMSRREAALAAVELFEGGHP